MSPCRPLPIGRSARAAALAILPGLRGVGGGLCLLLLTAAPSPAAGAGLDAARSFTLDNGLTVAVAADHAHPVVAVQMLFSVGARNEPTGVTGISHFVEHMLFRGTTGFPLADITGVIERAGGEWHGYTLLDQTTFFEAAPRAMLPTLLRLEAERMSAARMAPDEVEPERGAVFQELRGYQLDPRTELYDEAMATLFLQHRYRNNTMGWESDLAGISHADLLAWYRRYYRPRNAVLAIAGDFDETAIEAQVREAFAGVPAGGDDTALRTIEPPLSGQRRITVRRSGADPALQISFHAPPPSRARDYAALMVLDAILCNTPALSFLSAENGTTSGADAVPGSRLAALLPGSPAGRFGTSFLPTLYPYQYSIYADPRAGRAPAEVEPVVWLALREMEDTLQPAEVEAARRRLQGILPAETDSLVEVAHEMAFWIGLGGLDRRAAVVSEIARVGPDDVKRLLRGFVPERAVVATLLPAGEEAPGGAEAEERIPGGPGPARGEVSSGPGTARAAAPPPSPVTLRAATSPAVTTLDLGSGARAVIDSRPGQASFVLRIAARGNTPAGPAAARAVARLRGAAGILEEDDVTHADMQSRGVRLSVLAPGDASFAERDTLQIIAEGAAPELAATLARLVPAVAAALSAAGEAGTPGHGGHPAAQAIAALEEALGDRQGRAATTASGAPSGGSSAGRPSIQCAVVSPFSARSLRPALAPLAAASGAAGGSRVGGTKTRGASGSGATADIRSGAPGGAASLHPFPAGRRVIEMPDIPQGRLFLAIPGGEDPLALQALSWILHHSYSGRLGVKAIAGMGLVYEMDSEAVTRGTPLAYFTMGAAPASLGELETALSQVLDAARGGITADEVADWRRAIQGELPVRLSDPRKAAALWCSALLSGQDHRGPAARAARAQEVTLDRVAALARTALDPERRLTILVTRAGAAR